MAERLNELSNNVLISLQSSKKLSEAISSLRDLYLYLYKHNVALPSTTYNYLLTEFQDKDNGRFGNPKVVQLAVLVLFQAQRPVKQIQQGYIRAGPLLRSGISVTRECLNQIIRDMDTKMFFKQPSMWASILHHCLSYSTLQLTTTETNLVSMNLYNFISSNPSLLKRGRFSRGQKFYGPTGRALDTPLTVLCTSSKKQPTPLLYLHAITFSYLKAWIAFSPQCSIDIATKQDNTDLMSVYDEEASNIGGSIASRSAVSRAATNVTFQQNDNMYRENFFGQRSEISGTVYSTKSLNLTFSTSTGNPLHDATLQHITHAIEHCTKIPPDSNDKVVGLAVYLECIKILDTLYRSCDSTDTKHEILYSVSQILVNIMLDKTKYILIPAALSVMMKYSPDFKLAPEQNESLTFLFSDVIARNYETITLDYEIIMFCVKFAERLGNIFTVYFPNIFKIIAFRPTTFVREIATLLPYIYDVLLLEELFRAIVELPVLTALTFAKLKTSDFTNWLYRMQSNKVKPVDISRHTKKLAKHFTHPKVVTCSQLSSVLLELFFRQVLEKEHGLKIFWCCFRGVYKICNIPGYKEKTTDIMINFLHKVCNEFPTQVFTQHTTLITEYLSKIELYQDQLVSSKLVHVLITPLLNVDLSSEMVKELYKTIEQQLYIISAMKDVAELTNSLVMLLVVISVKEPSLSEQTSQCLSNIKKKVCSRNSTSESPAITSLIDRLNALIVHGSGSLVEIYKTKENLSVDQTLRMLTVLNLIDHVV